MIDIEKIKLPIWIWRRHFGAIEIAHFVKRLTDDTAFHLYGFAMDKIYTIKVFNDSFSAEEKKSNIFDSDVAKYSPISTFTETRETIKIIFKDLRLRLA